jgi:hypothetical protein
MNNQFGNVLPSRGSRGRAVGDRGLLANHTPPGFLGSNAAPRVLYCPASRRAER